MPTVGVLEGGGSAGVWGLSSALDLSAPLSELLAAAPVAPAEGDTIASARDLTPKITEVPNDGDTTSMERPSGISSESSLHSEDVNILIMDGRDARHIIKTIASAAVGSELTGRRTQLNFYIYERQAPLQARHMLLAYLFLAAANDEGANMNDKAQQLLEIFGNLLIRERTRDCIVALTPALIKLVTDGKGEFSDVFDFSWLRFRECDDIEAVFKFWRAERPDFAAASLWDMRLRRYYGVRYDARPDAVDWDYHMKLYDKASIVHKTEFLRWRLHGIAYEFRDGDSCFTPNKTAATVDVLKDASGTRATKWGYFGDIVTGPFIGYGVKTAKTELLRKANDMHTHTSAEVAEHNMLEMMRDFSRSKGKPTSPHVKITLLPCDPSHAVARLERARVRIHRAFVSASMAHLVGDVLQPGMFFHASTSATEVSTESLLVVETAKYVLDLTRDQAATFLSKLVELATSQGRFATIDPTHGGEGSTDPEVLVFQPNF
ncbi:Dynein assembly factor 3, axonemal [Cladochytrium tenue]|nr:Dynein assembly factor 3, axonemal [Cladochytrium tenue]